MMIEEILKLIYFLLPVYAADSSPWLFRHTLKSLEIPLDGRLKFRGLDLLGSHKTVRGIVVGILFGTIMFYFQQVLNISSIIMYEDYTVLLGFFLATGAMFGDLTKSFIKRRLKIAPGQEFLIADQIDAVLGAILFSSFIIDFTYVQIFIMIIVTLFLKLGIYSLILHIQK